MATARASDSCLMLDHVRVTNFLIIIMMIIIMFNIIVFLWGIS